MGFVDVFYYGQCKLVCTSAVTLDEGKTISIASSGGRTWSGTITDGKCEFLLPPRDKYTVSLVNAGVTEYSTKVFMGYGECKEVEVGLNPATPIGIKAIVNAGLESTFFEVGDQIEITEGVDTADYDIVEVGYRLGEYGHNIILQRHDCMTSRQSMNVSATNTGGFGTSKLAVWLNGEFFNSLSEDWQSIISEYSYYGGRGGQNGALQPEIHKIWLPLIYNVAGNTGSAISTEHTQGGAELFSYYAVGTSLAKKWNGTNTEWWVSSPNATAASAGNQAFCAILSNGSTGSYSADHTLGVAPAFMIAAD